MGWPEVCQVCSGTRVAELHVVEQRSFETSDQQFRITPPLGEPSETILELQLDVWQDRHPRLGCEVLPRSLPTLPGDWSWGDAAQRIEENLAFFGDRYDIVRRRATALALPLLFARWSEDDAVLILGCPPDLSVKWL